MGHEGHRRYRIADLTPPGGAAHAPMRTRPWPWLRILDAACWSFAGLVLALWCLIRWAPAGAWPVHLLLYGPRWVVALPLLGLAPLAVWRRRRRAAPALALAGLAAAAIWGWNVPWRAAGRPGPEPLRVLTCNVQRGDLRAPVLADWVRRTRPDLVLLQEWGSEGPEAVLGGGGWHVESAGEYCLASRHPITDFEALRRPDKPYRIVAVRARVHRPEGVVPVVNVHLLTPRAGLEALLASPARGLGAFREVARVQRAESDLLRRWVDEWADPRLVVAGDFNLTAEHPIFRADWSAYADAFSRAGWGLGHTMHTRRLGLRIDHVLSGPGWAPARVAVGPDVGSAHRPVLADLVGVPPRPGQE